MGKRVRLLPLLKRELMEKQKTARHLLWVDLETNGLPEDKPGFIDFTDVHLMEVGVILTDDVMNILPQGGYTEIVKMNEGIANGLRARPDVLEMHRTSGLVKDCMTATKTMEEIDTEIDALLTEVGTVKGDFAIAGSGVAMFDFPFIRSRMPKTASWLAYYPYDFGIFRRLLSACAGKYVLNPNMESYGPAKVHRAMDDIKAHLREAQAYRDWVRKIPEF